MNFFDVLGEMLVILFAIVAGFAARRLGWLGGETDQKLSKLLLNITMPAMILASVITGDELPEVSVILSVLEVGVAFYALALLFAYVVPRCLPGTPGQKGVWRYALAFPNVAFIGYPVAVALFGPQALFYAVILVMPFNLLSYSLGPLMLAGAGRFRWQQLLSPCIVASVAALLLALIMALGLFAFVFDTMGGIFLAKFMNLFTKKKINPMVGAAGISAFPMASRVIQQQGLKEDPGNHLLMHAAGANVAGQISSVIAGGVLISIAQTLI